jgi:hypothetical protein
MRATRILKAAALIPQVKVVASIVRGIKINCSLANHQSSNCYAPKPRYQANESNAGHGTPLHAMLNHTLLMLSIHPLYAIDPQFIVQIIPGTTVQQHIPRFLRKQPTHLQTPLSRIPKLQADRLTRLEMRVELQVEVLGEVQELQMDHSQVLGLMLKVQRRHLIELQYLLTLLQIIGQSFSYLR